MVDSQDVSLSQSPQSPKEVLPSPSTSVTANIALALSFLTLLGVLAIGYCLYMLQEKWTGFAHSLEQTQTKIEKIESVHQQNAKEQQNLEAMTQEIQKLQARVLALSQDPDPIFITLHTLVTSANERLQIAHDLPTAILQLKTMSEKLSAIQDPDFIPLKEALAKDIATLEQLPVSQRQVIWTTLSQFSDKFDKLHFKTLDGSLTKPSDESISPSNKAWQNALWRTWLELKSLVKITRDTSHNIPLALSGEEKNQILRVMYLMTEQAQWAVLSAQQIVYQKSLDNLQKMIRDYFSADLYQTTLLEEIDKLQQKNIAFENTHITQTQEALRALEKKLKADKTVLRPSRENP